MRKTFRSALLAILCLGCGDHGLEPAPLIEPGFGGVIFYVNWPPLDSLKDLRLVAFREFPPQNIFAEVINGRAYVFPRIEESQLRVRALLPYFVDSTSYDFRVPPGRYAYIAVAQQYGDSLFRDWRAVGQYDLDSDLTIPSELEVSDNTFVSNVDILVDFSDPPPTPIAP